MPRSYLFYLCNGKRSVQAYAYGMLIARYAFHFGSSSRCLTHYDLCRVFAESDHSRDYLDNLDLSEPVRSENPWWKTLQQKHCPSNCHPLLLLRVWGRLLLLVLHHRFDIDYFVLVEYFTVLYVSPELRGIHTTESLDPFQLQIFLFLCSSTITKSSHSHKILVFEGGLFEHQLLE